MKRVTVDDLPTEPLAAAGVFHQHWLPHIETALAGGEDVLVAFAPADHTHRQWRLAAIAGLARQYALCRAVAVSGEDAVIDAFERYLSDAEAITGQYLEGDCVGAGDPLGRVS
ncbi:MAG: Rossmann fold domain-containing protein [Sphingomonadaceae bacterium]